MNEKVSGKATVGVLIGGTMFGWALVALAADAIWIAMHL